MFTEHVRIKTRLNSLCCMEYRWSCKAVKSFCFPENNKIICMSGFSVGFPVENCSWLIWLFEIYGETRNSIGLFFFLASIKGSTGQFQWNKMASVGVSKAADIFFLPLHMPNSFSIKILCYFFSLVPIRWCILIKNINKVIGLL